MNILKVMVVCGLVALSSQRALGDAVVVDTLVYGQPVSTVLQPSLFGTGALDDPSVVVHRSMRGSPTARGIEDDFSFRLPHGSGDFDFFNFSDQTFHELTLTITPGGPAEGLLTLFNCGVTSDFPTLPFSNCSFAQIGSIDSSTVVHFYGGPGLAPRSDFSIELVGFEPCALVSVDASPVVTPEPGSLALVLTGMTMLVGGRKLRKGSV